VQVFEPATTQGYVGGNRDSIIIYKLLLLRVRAVFDVFDSGLFVTVSAVLKAVTTYIRVGEHWERVPLPLLKK
jgi:hypothetical protein